MYVYFSHFPSSTKLLLLIVFIRLVRFLIPGFIISEAGAVVVHFLIVMWENVVFIMLLSETNTGGWGVANWTLFHLFLKNLVGNCNF